MKRSLIAVALLSISVSAQADQQCSYIGQQVVCRDMPSYRDAQIDAQIPLMNNASVVNYGAPIAMYQPMGNEAAGVAGAAVLVGALFRGIGSLFSWGYNGIKSAFTEDSPYSQEHQDRLSMHR
jgi:hypothetical protein